MKSRDMLILGCFGMGCITLLGITAIWHLKIDGQLLAATVGAVSAVVGIIIGKATTKKETGEKE